MTSVRRMTPPGAGGVAVLAVESPARQPPVAWTGGGPTTWPDEGRVRHGRWLLDREVVDDVVVVGTASGAELHLHGGEGLVEAARAALGVGALAEARGGGPAPRSLREARAWASSLWGPVQRLVAEARAAGCAADLSGELAAQVRDCHARAGLARRLTDTAVVRIVGRPNAGKSTLFNALLGERRALTSPVAGTTRDVVRANLALKGVPIQLEDWAGGASTASEADLTVHLLSDESEQSWPGERVLRVRGKADRRAGGAAGAVSGLTGEGVPELAARVAEILELVGGPEDDVLAPVDPAHRRLVEELVADLDRV